MADRTDKTATSGNGPAGTTVVVREKSLAGLLVGIAFLAIAGGGGSAWFMVQRGRATEAPRTVETNLAPKYVVHLEGFTVNLADPEETHFLRVTMDLGIDRLPEGAEKDKPAAALPVGRIRDAILSVLTASKADALLTQEGKTQLKKNLVDALTHNVPELGVKDVYFTEFLVQR